MMLKIVSLFLIFMAVLAMFGRLKLPGIGGTKGAALPRPKLCPDCGRYSLRGEPCRHCRDRDGPGRGPGDSGQV